MYEMDYNIKVQSYISNIIFSAILIGAYLDCECMLNAEYRLEIFVIWPLR